MLTRTGCYFSTASMLMMIGQHDIEKANTSPLGAIKKQITNQLACRIVEFPSSTKSSDKLAGEFRSGTTILITDLMYRVGTSTGSHDMGMEEIRRFSLGCGVETGNLLNWFDLSNKVDLLVHVKKLKGPSCTYREGECVSVLVTVRKNLLLTKKIFCSGATPA